MAQYIEMQGTHRHGQPEAAGVLLVNLGTPQAPTAAAVRRYLKQFLSDRRVVDVPRPLWWLILNGVILRIRPRRVARLYAAIWTDAGSPLMALTRALTQGLEAEINRRHGPRPIAVEMAMTYGQPSVDEALRRLAERNVRRLLVMPLYPQYSGTTTAAAVDAVSQALTQSRWLPELRFVNQYHDQPAYIDALAQRVARHQQEHGEPDKLLLSFHGIPQRFVAEGDPYFCHCQVTARLLAERLELPPARIETTFQSRFGREPWLQPYTDIRLAAMPSEGVGHVQVVCPGFAVDCLETLEEIALQNREIFTAAGGDRFSYIPALNDDPAHAALLADLAALHSQGWPQWSDDYDAQATLTAANESARRASELGAQQ